MTQIDLKQDVLSDNARAAADHRSRFAASGTYVLNLMSGPGAGKTTLLERTASGLRNRLRMAVITGDIETRRDADRIARYEIPVIQLNTGGACHIDARILTGCIDSLDLELIDLLIIENIGNLVCPAEFDLGEHDKAMILSVTEGHDKPAKYPLMFSEARTMLLNKIDLLPYVSFDVDAALSDVHKLNPEINVLWISATSGEGLDGWLDWLVSRVEAVRAAGAAEGG